MAVYELQSHYTAIEFTNRNGGAYVGVAPNTQPLLNDPLALDPNVLEGGAVTAVDHRDESAVLSLTGLVEFRTTIADGFYEEMHVIPRTLILGNILAAQSISVEIFNGFRHDDRSWTNFVNNAGVGTDLVTTVPPPTLVIPNLGGLTRTLEISTSGPAVVNTTLDFDFDVGMIQIPISFQRVVLFAVVPPEQPYREMLQFRTDVMTKFRGKEQRISVRKNPRQVFEFEFRLEDGRERVRVENFLFQKLGTAFGIPVWHELTPLTSAAAATDLTVNVVDTTFADFRVGGFAVVYQDGDVFDVLSIDSKTATSITFTSQLVNSYPIGTAVIPLLTARSTATASGVRWPRNLSRINLSFEVIDNDISIASGAAFNTYNSKVLLDDFNFVRGTSPESWDRIVSRFDSGTGLILQNPISDQMVHRGEKFFIAKNRQELWELRQLLHLIRGRQTSFYLPTFRDELEVILPLTAATNLMDIDNVGYSQSVDSLQPRNVIRVTTTSGSKFIRQVDSAVEVDSTRETLTLDSTWASTIAVADVERVEFVEKVRFDTDDITVQHDLGQGAAIVRVPIKAVLE